jgi:hypothetical protein
MVPPSWQQVDAAIDAGEILELARQMVATPSYAAEHHREAGVARVLEEFLSREGFAVTPSRSWTAARI